MRTRNHRLSFLRILAAIAVVGGLSVAAFALVRGVVTGVARAEGPGPWYAPYVDATLTPTYPFESKTSNPSNDVVLGFVVAGRDGNCVPTWGTYYDLDGAGRVLDLDRRIDRLRNRGGDVMISFGGAANDELALHCTETRLRSAYESVVRRYRATTLDFDIEGAAFADADANARRAAAVKALQRSAAARHRRLAVWLTLPVSPTGLSSEGVATIDAMLRARVSLAGVNLLTMDFGSSRAAGVDIVAATDQALLAASRQLDGAYRRAGLLLGPGALWHRLGMTPMIGQNDTPTDRVTVADAQRLLTLARKRHLGRVSIWSLNRDTQCGAQLDSGIVSNLCSGVRQAPLAFTSVFSRLPGRATTVHEEAAPVPLRTQPPDDPAHSPYPIWSDTKVYTAGAKVTWHHNVYQAKWWSRANVPDAPVVHEWDTPWRFLGPVLPGDHPVVAPKLRPGTYPRWRRTTVYVKGDQVEWRGVGYEAKWWNHGEPPDTAGTDEYNSPWEALPPPAASR